MVSALLETELISTGSCREESACTAKPAGLGCLQRGPGLSLATPGMNSDGIRFPQWVMRGPISYAFSIVPPSCYL